MDLRCPAVHNCVVIEILSAVGPLLTLYLKAEIMKARKQGRNEQEIQNSEV